MQTSHRLTLLKAPYLLSHGRRNARAEALTMSNKTTRRNYDTYLEKQNLLSSIELNMTTFLQVTIQREVLVLDSY